MHKKKKVITKFAPTKREKAKPERRADGKFLPGHSIKSPGNPHHQRICEYRNAIKSAITEDDLRQVFATLKKLALRGDIDAIRELLNRTLGKARIADTMLSDIELPEITNTRDTVKASNAIIAAVRSGKLSTDDAAKLGALVELTRRTLETNELAERLAALEKEMNREQDV